MTYSLHTYLQEKSSLLNENLNCSQVSKHLTHDDEEYCTKPYGKETVMRG